jgi:hypothetical protein
MGALILGVKVGFAIMLLVLLKLWRPLRRWRDASEWFPWIFAAVYLAHRVLRAPSAERLLDVAIESLGWLLVFLVLLYATRGEAEALRSRPRLQLAVMAGACGVVLLRMII